MKPLTYYYLFIYLLKFNPLPPPRDRHASCQEQEKKRKGIEVQRVKPLTPSWAIDVLIGDKEQNGIQKKEKKKKKKQSGAQTQLP